MTALRLNTAANHGQPAVLANRWSGFTRQFAKLAEQLEGKVGHNGATASQLATSTGAALSWLRQRLQSKGGSGS